MTKISSIRKPIGKAFDYTAKNWFAKSLEKARLEPVKYAGRTMVLSFITKDLINTCIYTYQSFNNKKIPEEKRNFVAANDLVLGFFNFGGQLGSYALFETLAVPVLQGKKFTGQLKIGDTPGVNKYSNAPMSPDTIRKFTHEVINEHSDVFKNINAESIKNISADMVKKMGPNGSKCKDIIAGLTIVTGALCTTALVKRTISPLFSTPIAGWLSNKWDKKAATDNTKQSPLNAEPSQVLYKGKIQDKSKK